MEDKSNYDVVALIDFVRGTEILTDIEFSDFKKSVYDINFFTNRRKVDVDAFNSIMSEKTYFNKIKDLLKEKKSYFNF
jgi:hypothetical protein